MGTRGKCLWECAAACYRGKFIRGGLSRFTGGLLARLLKIGTAPPCPLSSLLLIRSIIIIPRACLQEKSVCFCRCFDINFKGLGSAPPHCLRAGKCAPPVVSLLPRNPALFKKALMNRERESREAG